MAERRPVKAMVTGSSPVSGAVNLNQQFFIGFFALLAAFVGHYIVSPFISLLRKEAFSDDQDLQRVLKPSKLLGMLERFMYVVAYFIKPEFIGVWLGVKALGQWNHYRSGDKSVETSGRGQFTVFLIGTGLSLIVALTFAWLASIFIALNIYFFNLQVHMDWKTLSEVFYNFTVGIGAILAGGAGFVAFREYAASSKNKARINVYKSRYNRGGLVRGDFSLVHSAVKGQEDRIYIIDKVAKIKHWIVTPKTLNDLGFQFSDAAFSADLFNSFPVEGESINFY